MSIREITYEQLRRKISKNALPFETTDEIDSLKSVIGQERAIKALQLGLELDAKGYNIFATGVSGTGRTTIIKQFLKKYAQKAPVPDDWCYVFNFTDPDAPRALHLPAGKGKDFQEDMVQLIKTLQREFKRVFSGEHYESQKAAIINVINQEKRQLMQALEDKARAQNLSVQPTTTGFQTIPLKDNQPLTQEEFGQLTDEERQQIGERVQEMEQAISETVRLLSKLDIKAEKSLSKLDKDVAGYIVEQYVNDIKETYGKFPQVINYLDDVCKDIVRNSAAFFEKPEGGPGSEAAALQQQHFKRYHVNVAVDNSLLKGAPVIHETNPNYNNLIGRIEKFPVSGGYVTDFTMIKSGSLLKANGGYLIIDAGEIFSNHFVYDALKRSLRNEEIRIEDAAESYGTVSIASLKPQAIPMKLKVVLIGWSRIYHILSQHDDDFLKVFKVRADFDYEADSNNKVIQQYARFIKKVISEENLLPFHRDAVEEVIQYGHRLADDQKKISLEFGQIIKIIEQAVFWAAKEKQSIVRAAHVNKAIIEYEFRHSRYKEKYIENIERNIKRIIVDGETVGEINALSVISLGELSFGSPSRITAKTYIGSESLVNIERKAGLTGKIHDKGSYILSGFFNSKFGQYQPVSFAASLAFEQSYSRIDGDSASSTELYVLISSLTNVPIKQTIAVTGSVNQNGEVQAIGGVNEKIEGFFEVCKFKGLTGEQGVMIPRSNTVDLMLKEEVRQAIKDGKFHIWTVDNIEDGLRLLTGIRAGSRNKSGKFSKGTLYYMVEERMREYALRSEAHRKSISDEHKRRTGEKKNNNKNGNNNGD